MAGVDEGAATMRVHYDDGDRRQHSIDGEEWYFTNDPGYAVLTRPRTAAQEERLRRWVEQCDMAKKQKSDKESRQRALLMEAKLEELEDEKKRAPLQGQEWACPYCTCFNEVWRKKCIACNKHGRAIVIASIKHADMLKMQCEVGHIGAEG